MAVPRSRPLSSAANRQGIAAMLLAMSAFIGSDTLLKIATTSLPPGEIMAVRGLFASLITVGLVGATGAFGQVRRLLSPLVLARAALEAVTAFLFITALGQLPLADVTAIMQATPLLLAAMAVLFGLETVGRRRWAAIAVGFFGVLLIVKPSGAGFDVYALLALACAAVVAGRDLVTRFIPAEVPSVVIALSTTVAVAGAGLGIGVGETWAAPSPFAYGLLAGAAVFVAVGNLAIIRAARVGDPSVVSPFRYSIVVMSVAIGLLVFGERPDLLSTIGIVLVLGSGLHALRTKAGREEAGDAPKPLADTAT